MGQSEIQPNQSHIEVLHIAPDELQPALKILPFQNDSKPSSLQYVLQEKVRDKKVAIIFQQRQSGTSEDRNKYRVEHNSYDYMCHQILLQNDGMEIQKILTDQLDCSKILYLTKRRRAQSSILFRLYKQEKSNQHLTILKEIYYYEKVKLLHCHSLHIMIKSYCIKSNPKIGSQHVQVLILEHINTTLQEIIKSKRINRQILEVRQFMHLMVNLIEAVSVLHSSGLMHNDIRPPNIYYSSMKKRFILGSFSKMTSINDSGRLQKQNYSTQNMQQDVYMLGMTLLSVFYLVPFIDRKKCAPFNRMLISKYPILQIIKLMVCSPQKRSNIFQIRQMLKKYEKLYSISQITSLKFPQNHRVAKSQQLTYRYKRLCSDFYKHFGLIDKWKQSMNDPIIHHKLSQQTIESASSFQELALISQIQGSQQNFKNYYKHSASIYLNIGKKHHIERDYCFSIKMFEKGLVIMDKIGSKSDDILYLSLEIALRESEIISGQKEIQLNQIKRLQSIILSLKKQDYFTFWKFVEILICIYRYLEKYDDIRKLLKECDELSDNIEAKIGPITIKKAIALNNIQIANLTNDVNPSKINFIKQTEQLIKIILDHKQYYFILNPLQKMQMQYLNAKLLFLAGEKLRALEQIQDALFQLKQYSSFTKQSSNHLQNSIQHQLLRGSMLQFLGDIWISFGQIQESLNCYSLALQQYKNYFGDIYNIQSAVILEKIAQTYKKKCNYLQYVNKLELSLKIVRTEYGKYHKNNIRLTGIRKNLEVNLQGDTKEIICPFTLGRSRFDTESNLSQFK